ncbi:MAG TPA: aminoacyl-tRNA hydrolase [Woeseiaceae bacterium]
MSGHISIIAGLGNPDERYAQTLHNAGFWFVDALARKLGAQFRAEKRFDTEICRARIGGEDIWLMKPQSFMNLSGGPIRAVLDYYRLSTDTLLVAHDEIDLPPGTVRLKKGGGHGGHNGIRDVIGHCGADFMRLRLGVGHPGDKDRVTGYVLQAASRDVENDVRRNIEEAIAIMPMLVTDGLNAAMKALHTQASNES